VIGRIAAAALVLLAAGCASRVVEPPFAGAPVARDEMERLAAAGISEAVQVELVEQRGALPLTADDLVALKKAGVSDAVLQRMMALERKEPEVRYVDEVRYYDRYYYDPWPWYGTWGVGIHHTHPHFGVGVRIRR
jgi:hypothetical protein